MTSAPTPVAAEPESEQQPVVKPMGLSDLTTLAHNYHVPMSEGTLKQLLGPNGEADPQKVQSFEDYLKTTASGLYPTLAPQLKAGIPTAFLLDPYRQLGKQVLGEDFEPNFQSDPNARAALQGGTDAQGHPTPMSLAQWEAHLKSNPAFGYQDTPKGQLETMQMKQRIAQALGASSDAS
ncbi:MAG: hypothetical protein HKL85_01290 [Acidimicrobiaceae bacterium]|nr:hypothetical protein [Acidimicrobiaceae bacterium]